jgi:hypothetical protein
MRDQTPQETGARGVVIGLLGIYFIGSPFLIGG